MFVQFRIKNFSSFKNEITLDMTAINAYKEHENNLIDIGTKEKFVKVAAIYGANASGKSNLNKALQYFQKIIRESLNNVEDKETQAISKYYVPFEFDKVRENTEFEIVKINDKYEYKYGFEYNKEKIVSEWLYRKSITTSRNTIIFERGLDGIEFGASVRKECDAYKLQIPLETLVLSFFNKLKLKTKLFTSIYKDITEMLITDSDKFENTNFLKKILPRFMDIDKEDLSKFLCAIDTGIKDIYYEENDDEVNIWTVHHDGEGNKYKLNLFNESQGTIKSILIYIYSKVNIQNNKAMFIDELNIKLHPLLLKFIIDLFYENKSKAQLIYTTHDTTLLDRKFFRRDQIWFVQKDRLGQSELLALSDFKVRSDSSFEKDYLAGVYGGIPLLKDFQIEEGE